ncbi:hypothetical protein ACOMHN_029876 [Nucella lapillus]
MMSSPAIINRSDFYDPSTRNKQDPKNPGDKSTDNILVPILVVTTGIGIIGFVVFAVYVAVRRTPAYKSGSMTTRIQTHLETATPDQQEATELSEIGADDSSWQMQREPFPNNGRSDLNISKDSSGLNMNQKEAKISVNMSHIFKPESGFGNREPEPDSSTREPEPEPYFSTREPDFSTREPEPEPDFSTTEPEPDFSTREPEPEPDQILAAQSRNQSLMPTG